MVEFCSDWACAMQNLKRELSLLGVFCIASGAMISSGLFVLPGMAYAKAGPAIVVCYLLAGLLSLPGMLSLAEMATAMPKAGADCYTVIRSMGPGMGTVAGLLSWFSLSMKSAFALVGMSVFTVAVVNVDVRAIAVSCCIAFLVINILGIKEAAKTQVLLVSVLFALMFLYVVLGLPRVSVQRFEPFAPKGPTAIYAVAGYVFISYAGLLKVASIAEEIRNPSRNIPLGMILPLLVVTVFYALMVLTTVGVLEGSELSGSLTPISDGAAVFMGRPGSIALGLAAIMAFLTTANAGIMTAARSLVPLSRERLFPSFFGRVNARFGTPHNALLLTGAFIAASLFLKLEVLVEAASIVLILTNVFSCVSVILLRESGLQNYRPAFRAPLYPWLQIIGLVAFGFILLEMGAEAYLISALLASAAFCTYWFYGRKNVRQESALLHLIKRITARELTTRTLEAELKEVIRERDGIVSDRLDHVIEDCVILDIDRQVQADEFFRMVSDALASRTTVPAEVILQSLVDRERQGTTAITSTLAVPHILLEGKGIFDILIARSREGIVFSDSASQVQAVFVLVGTMDERNMHLCGLAAIAQIAHNPEFDRRWLRAKTVEDLRDVVLLSERRR